MLKKVYLCAEVGSIVYLVFASKREGNRENIVVKCKVDHAVIYKHNTIYCCEMIKVVTKTGAEEAKNWETTFMFENPNVDTGYRSKPNRYPVFTTKEKCLEWLKG